MTYVSDCTALNPAVRKSFTVFGSNKLHKAKKKVFKAIDRIASASVAELDGSVIVLKDSYSDLISLHYPKAVSYFRDVCYTVGASQLFLLYNCSLLSLTGT